MLDFNPNFQKAIDLVLNTDTNLFVTGKAGTGKSTFLRYIAENTTKQKAILAPTGLAAINIQGQTIHSFFKLGPGASFKDGIKIGNKLKENKVIEKLELLIIDEISMVRADMLDIIDTILRTARSDIRAFGGVQVIFIGDLYQLSPIVKYEELELLKRIYPTPYFFSANVFNYLLQNLGNHLEFIELDKIYRQNQPEFIELLNKIRFNRIGYNELNDLNKKVNPNWITLDDKHIILTTRNDQAAKLNQERLNKIDSPVQKYKGKISGDFNPKNLPTELDLELKVGARVMFVKNDLYGKWVNGTLGTVKKLGFVSVEVELDEGKVVVVEKEDWQIYHASFDQGTNSIVNESVGSFNQLPLKLSWAITIHKSQGQTFNKMILDLGKGAFSAGQTYVALSRCSNLEGLVLASPIRKNDIRTDYNVVNFFKLLDQKLANETNDFEDTFMVE
jgi:ATP-dependent DNA helicase PIF1